MAPQDLSAGELGAFVDDELAAQLAVVGELAGAGHAQAGDEGAEGGRFGGVSGGGEAKQDEPAAGEGVVEVDPVGVGGELGADGGGVDEHGEAVAEALHAGAQGAVVGEQGDGALQRLGGALVAGLGDPAHEAVGGVGRFQEGHDFGQAAELAGGLEGAEDGVEVAAGGLLVVRLGPALHLEQRVAQGGGVPVGERVPRGGAADGEYVRVGVDLADEPGEGGVALEVDDQGAHARAAEPVEEQSEEVGLAHAAGPEDEGVLTQQLGAEGVAVPAAAERAAQENRALLPGGGLGGGGHTSPDRVRLPSALPALPPPAAEGEEHCEGAVHPGLALAQVVAQVKQAGLVGGGGPGDRPEANLLAGGQPSAELRLPVFDGVRRRREGRPQRALSALPARRILGGPRRTRFGGGNGGNTDGAGRRSVAAYSQHHVGVLGVGGGPGDGHAQLSGLRG